MLQSISFEFAYFPSKGYDDNAQQIAITQRPAVLPYNYHAQVTHQYGDDLNNEYSSTEASDDNLYKRSSNQKRQSIQNREDQYKKFTKLANRMKSRMLANKQADTNPQNVQA